jgi:hypothetical protein
MPVNKIDLTVSQLINDLNNGLTWLKKDDLGYGSIEVKYTANPTQIAAIRKHPALKDAETNITVFNIIDDTAKTGSDYDVDVKKTSKPTTASIVDVNPVSVESDAANYFEIL